ncbi:MAG: ribbon-helix-helix domain-containing protein [Waterburya sp.]
MKKDMVRTTFTIPIKLLEATDQAIKSGKAKSRNEFMAMALQREIAAQKRAEIDKALTEMLQDPEYQAEVLKLEAEFANAQWEALKIGETQE